MMTSTTPKTKKPKTKKKYFGRVPSAKYEVLGFQHEDWLLFVREPRRPDWLNLKLARRGSSERRSNFFIAWHQTEQRFGRCTDQPELERNEPELVTELISYLSGRTLTEAPPEGAE